MWQKPNRVFASGKEPQGWDRKPAGVWCLQLYDWKQDPVTMGARGAAGGGTRLAGPRLVVGHWLGWRQLSDVTGTEESVLPLYQQ